MKWACASSFSDFAVSHSVAASILTSKRSCRETGGQVAQSQMCLKDSGVVWEWSKKCGEPSRKSGAINLL